MKMYGRGGMSGGAVGRLPSLDARPPPPPVAVEGTSEVRKEEREVKQPERNVVSGVGVQVEKNEGDEDVSDDDSDDDWGSDSD